MSIYAIRRPGPSYFGDMKPCTRCGIERNVKNPNRDSGMCGDCRLIELDLAAPPRIDDRCGSWGGWWQHRRVRNEKPCVECAAFMRAAKRKGA